MELLSEKEDIYLELIRKADELKYSAGNKDELSRVLMNTFEHSFFNAISNLIIMLVTISLRKRSQKKSEMCQ